jgi:hypothetical protein
MTTTKNERVMLHSAPGALLNIPKKESKDKINVERLTFYIFKAHRMHKFQDEISLLISLTSVPGALFSISKMKSELTLY